MSDPISFPKSTPSVDTKEIKKKIINYASGFVFDKINTFIENKNKPSTNSNSNSMDQQQFQQEPQEKQHVTSSKTQSNKINNNKYGGYIEEDDKLLEVLITSPQDLDVNNHQIHEQQSEILDHKKSNKNELNRERKKIHKKKEHFYQTQSIRNSDDNDDDYLTADSGDSDDSDDDSIVTKNNINIRNIDEKINKKQNQSGVEESSKINNDKTNGNETTTNTLSTQNGNNEKNLLVNNTTPNIGASVGHSHSSSSTTDYSGYIQKKSLAQGMMDLALLSANTNQLRYILEYKDQHPYFATSFSLVIASLFLQIAVGLALIWNTKFNVKKRNEMKEADRVNNFGVVCIFLVTLINVFLSTFGGAPNAKSPDVAVTASDVGTTAFTDTVTAILTEATTTTTTTAPIINDESVLYN